MIIAWIGGITALMAALIGTQQDDIKKVLAYSTLSQLGYMVMATGLALHDPATHGSAAMFHLYTHAFFKALLFLGSGAIIYACHHEQNIWKMGGLRQKMPITFWTFLAGTVALMGVPGTSGFFSKESILGLALEQNKILFAVGVFTALLTAFYMTRLVIVVFTGKARDEGASHAEEAPMIMIVPLLLLAVPSLVSAYPFVAPHLGALVPTDEHEGGTVVMICSLIALLVGAFGGWKLYAGRNADPVNIPLLKNKFYFDEFYAGLVKWGQDWVAWIVTAIQRLFADGLIAHVPAALARGLGSWFRRLQTGSLQTYTLLFGLGVVAAIYLAVFLTMKH
jgi:NADH-quinone oxidoreductase subunit L